MICYHIVEKYNGSIDFQSSKGKGTTVTIRFPSKKFSMLSEGALTKKDYSNIIIARWFIIKF